jgi:hypothetical protein
LIDVKEASGGAAVSPDDDSFEYGVKIYPNTWEVPFGSWLFARGAYVSVLDTTSGQLKQFASSSMIPDNNLIHTLGGSGTYIITVVIGPTTLETMLGLAEGANQGVSQRKGGSVVGIGPTAVDPNTGIPRAASPSDGPTYAPTISFTVEVYRRRKA